MAQNQDAVAGPSCMISNEDYNGLRICKRDISIELLREIFCYLDRRTLLNCQLVCKQWKIIIQNYVWWKKAGLLFNKLFSRREDLPWQVFYLIYKKKPSFERNLLKNHSGEQHFEYWYMYSILYPTFHNIVSPSCWRIENPPSGVPELPLTESVFEGKQYCFANFYDFRLVVEQDIQIKNPKSQKINITFEGFDSYIMDVLQPPIMISEWYSCQNNFPAEYYCEIELLSSPKTRSGSLNILDKFQFTDFIEGEKLGKWLYISHIFTNYGHGLRWITFKHRGAYRLSNLATFEEPIYYGCKMAGACVRIMIP